MKSVFYLGILDDTNLSVSDKLVYCQILYRSLWDNSEETFDKQGYFAPENYSNGEVPIGITVSSSIADSVNISKRQYFASLNRLRELEYIISGDAYTPDGYVVMSNCLTSEYFKLRTETGLTGLSLIVYSYIHFKSAKYKVVDKYHAAIASELRMSRSHLEQILTKLREGRHIIVKERKRQRLLRPTHGTD